MSLFGKFKYFDVRTIMDSFPQCKYYMVFGERSNGKTFSALDLGLEKASQEKREQFAYIRRYDEDLKKSTMMSLFSGHEKAGRIQKYFPSWQYVDYTSREFRLARNLANRKTTEYDKVPIGYAFSISTWERSKGSSFPYVTTIIFDEFLSRTGYLQNEFISFQNLLSSIIRDRDDAKIIMLGNTVNRYCPYFGEMGLKHINKQNPGETNIYSYGDSGLAIAVTYTPSGREQGGKASDVYFAFDNPGLKMITSGDWEIAVYPRLPEKYDKKEVIITFFVEFEREIVAGDIVSQQGKAPYIYWYPKYTGIPKWDEKKRIYSNRWEFSDNRFMGLTKQNDKLSRLIIELIRTNRCAYATNETGEVVRNFLRWSSQQNILA